MSFISELPQTARNTYRFHLRASIFSGMRYGVVRIIQIICALGFGASSVHLAVISAAIGLGMIASLGLGIHMKNRPKLPYLIWAGILSNLGLILAGFTSSLNIFTALVSLQAFMDTCCLPAFSAIQRYNYPDKQRGAIVGRVRTIFMIFGIGSVVLASELLNFNSNSYRIIMPAAGIMGLLYVLMIARIRPEEKEDGPKQRTSENFRRILSTIFHNNGFMGYLLGIGFLEMGIFILGPVIPLFLVKLETGYRMMTLVLTIIPGLLGMLTFRSWGRLIDRHNVVIVRTVGAGFLLAEPLALIFSPQLARVMAVPVISFIAAGAAVRGLAIGSNVLTSSLMPLHYSGKSEVTVYSGIHTALIGLRLLVAPFIGAWLLNSFGFETVFQSASVMMILGLTVFSLLALAGRRSVSRKNTSRFHHKPAENHA